MASTAEELPAPTVVAPELLQRFAKISDGRRDQGRIHPVAVVLALCAGAVVAGMSSFTAIAGWVADLPRELLVQLYRYRGEPAPGPPSKATIWRVVTGADSAAVDAVVGAWLVEQAAARDNASGENTGDEPDAALVPIAVDGKTVRGATDPEGNQVRLLAAATHQDALVVGQVEVGAKTNEVRREAPCRIPKRVRRNSEDCSWVRWLTRSRKVIGDQSMP